MMSNDAPHPALSAIEIGTRLTDYAAFDLTVEGMASGGMGLVVWGPNVARGGNVEAAKLLRPDLLAAASTPEQWRQLQADFEREALIWCHLWPHPYLITADTLTRLPGWSGMPVLMLEYAQRGSLRRWLVEAHQADKALRWQTALAWAQQIAAALVAIHTPDPEHERPEPLVHCDLKPENVLIMGNGWANLTDLGLTRALANVAASVTIPITPAEPEQSPQHQTISQIPTLIVPAPPGASGSSPAASAIDDHAERIARMRAALIKAGALPTAAATPAPSASERGRRSQRIPALPTVAAIGSRGPVAGTPEYMSPEQWWGLDAVTPATDIYAFGVLLFELFAGVSYLLPHDEPSRFLPQNEFFAAWYERHRRGPVRALSAPEVQALLTGPLVALEQGQGETGRQLAQQALMRLDRLIGSCLAPQASLRPNAAGVQRALSDLAQYLGETPEDVPDILPHTPAKEAIFWNSLAVTYGNIGQKQERLRLQRRAIALDDTNPTNWINLGNALVELKQYQEALAAYAEADRRLTPAQIASHHPAVHSLPNNQGNVLQYLGRYAEAAEAYERSLAIQRDQADVLSNLAVNYCQWAEADLQQMKEEGAVSAATLAQLAERVRKGQIAAQQALTLAPGLLHAQQAKKDLAALADLLQRIASNS